MYFGIIEDEREQGKVIHRLIDILKLVMIAILCASQLFKQNINKIIDFF